MKQSWQEGTTTERVCMVAWALIGVGFVVSILTQQGLPSSSTIATLASAMVIVLVFFVNAKVARTRRERLPQ